MERFEPTAIVLFPAFWPLTMRGRQSYLWITNTLVGVVGLEPTCTKDRFYRPASQPIAQHSQIWLLCYFANFGRLVSLLIIITQGVTHPSVTLLFLSPDVATPTRGTITLFAEYLGFEPRTTRLTVESSTAELILNLSRWEESNLRLLLGRKE
jgi:hypothetical protein